MEVQRSPAIGAARCGLSHACVRLSAVAAFTACLGFQAGARVSSPQTNTAPSPESLDEGRQLVERYCINCHNDRAKTGGLTLDNLDPMHVETNPEAWEKVVRKLRSAAMPPPGLPRPEPAASNRFAAGLETALDRLGRRTPNPGRLDIHRLNRTEYVNAVRDLLAVELDGPSLLPADDISEGFDNMASVLTVSPMLMERYLAAARRVSRLAVGDPTIGPGFEATIHDVPTNLFQDDRMSEDLPFGSRGGVAIRHHFPLHGEYHIKIKLRRNLYNMIRGLREEHRLEVRIDGVHVRTFTVGGGDRGKAPPISFEQAPQSEAWVTYLQEADNDLEVRVAVSAGTRIIGVSFARQDWEPEGVLQPGSSQFAFSTDASRSSPTSGKREPAVDSVSVTGPYDSSPAGQTPSRQRLFVCRPSIRTEEISCAKRILSGVARRAYRRPVADADLQRLLPFYETGRKDGDFESGVQEALTRILVDPEFLFRLERAPVSAAGSTYRLTDLQLASRLSFFLWSSIPDDELLELASRGKLSDPATLERQVRRMVADVRARALVENFGGQWLQLRNLAAVVPNAELFPETEFDENLREAFRRETELFVESQLREDRSVVDLLTANYTYVNERLARHYRMANVYGPWFRRVAVPNNQRGGLLGQGSILMLTSYADRTSPVTRGKWLLDNIFGTPPPPPPANVPSLPEKGRDGKAVSIRTAMERHRSNPACANCHVRMDPLGLALENFDAIGRWRTANDDGTPIDVSGALPDGTRFEGVAGLRQLAVSHRDEFVKTFTEKLLMYAIGRGVEYYDMPAVRQILRDAAPGNSRWSSIILGIVKSVPFQMRRSES